LLGAQGVLILPDGQHYGVNLKATSRNYFHFYCHFNGAERVLVKRQIFAKSKLEQKSESGTVTWIRFCNIVSLSFVTNVNKAQSLEDFTLRQYWRGLGASELHHLHIKCENAKTLTSVQFDQFFKVFDDYCFLFKSSDPIIASLWNKGVIHGVMDSNTVTNILQRHRPGTCMIRIHLQDLFHLYQWQISYVSIDDGKIVCNCIHTNVFRTSLRMRTFFSRSKESKHFKYVLTSDNVLIPIQDFQLIFC